MAQLGWYIRQIRTQTIWLTATLPPVMQEQFIEHNKLVKPRIIRESMNRSNIKYMVSRETGPGTLIEKAANLVRAYWPRKEIFDHAQDKIILYCRTRDEVALLANTLGCPSYTSESGSDEEKAAILARWLFDRDQLAIAATFALGIGFDYPHVRWVVHVNAPDERYCSRGVLSQFLNAQPDWRWCMAGEEVCQVCGEPYTEARPRDLTFALETPAGIVFTRPEEVLRQDYARDQVLDSYERDLQTMVGNCLYCRVEGRSFAHAA
ncbi:hypothetical protein EG329_013812, partial [Mollisiaceae sp. DMI_Dod_QoI]